MVLARRVGSRDCRLCKLTSWKHSACTHARLQMMRLADRGAHGVVMARRAYMYHMTTPHGRLSRLCLCTVCGQRPMLLLGRRPWGRPVTTR
eukprot:5738483-Pyramimonas_sp.AAC.1